MEANSAQISSRNLTACHNPNKRAAGDLVQIYWQNGTKSSAGAGGVNHNAPAAMP
jgi:hypothetical protein